MAEIRRAREVAEGLVSEWVLKHAASMNSTRELTRMIEEAILEARDVGRTQAAVAGKIYFGSGGTTTNH